MPSVADKWADALLEDAIALMGYEESLRREIIGILEMLFEDLENEILTKNIARGRTHIIRRNRAEGLIRTIRKTIRDAFKDMDGVLTKGLQGLGPITSENLAAITTQVGGPQLSRALSKSKLKSLVDDLLLEGNPASDWWSRQSEGLRMRFAQQIRAGVIAGEGTDDLVRRIRGRQTGVKQVLTINGKSRLVPVFQGGIGDLTHRQATTLVRTATQSLYNDILYETYLRNTDVVEGVQALVTLDHRTSMICMARSGGVWNIETGDPLPSSDVDTPFPGPPPWHFNCRTILIPVLEGQIVKDLSFEAWFKTKSKRFQKNALGPGRYELWSEGKLPMRSLITPSGRVRTLEELRRAG